MIIIYLSNFSTNIQEIVPEYRSIHIREGPFLLQKVCDRALVTCLQKHAIPILMPSRAIYHLHYLGSFLLRKTWSQEKYEF